MFASTGTGCAGSPKHAHIPSMSQRPDARGRPAPSRSRTEAPEGLRRGLLARKEGGTLGDVAAGQIEPLKAIQALSRYAPRAAKRLPELPGLCGHEGPDQDREPRQLADQ